MEPSGIGIVTIRYNESGKPVDATLRPTINISFDEHVYNQLREVKSSKDKDIILSNANLIFGAWFLEVNNIEDSSVNVEGEIVRCEHYGSGMIKECEIRYTYRKLEVV